MSERSAKNIIEDNAREVRRKWGSDDAFYKELQDFHEKHRGCHSITYDNNTGYPVYAQYLFWPTLVEREHNELIAKLLEAKKEAGL